jgi:hypothetical protein
MMLKPSKVMRSPPFDTTLDEIVVFGRAWEYLVLCGLGGGDIDYLLVRPGRSMAIGEVPSRIRQDLAIADCLQFRPGS